jgi:hypothetical protein
MKRMGEVQTAQDLHGEQPLRETLFQLRPKECADPEILFVPGHCEEKVRRLIYREADGIRRALSAGALGRPLAKFSLLSEAVTPSWLTRRSSMFQGLHFAGPISKPLDQAEITATSWLLKWAGEAEQEPAGSQFEGQSPVDLTEEEDLEVVGVDPITVLLDTVSARAEARGSQVLPPDQAKTATLHPPPLWLEDGPVQPEDLGNRGGVPPFVFANSYLSLPEMGARFLDAGASVFLGPVAALYSGPARKFAGCFYSFLADGHSAATALHQAALACREQFGADHPVWLSYGLVGYGSLALQYL